ncbi:MAG TPA: DUF3293 domain-containing protein [Gemmatimonadaceae bacterium]|nr:DUF3293 domain-containing protein [Gemmatimonadaceae bacterium]
MSRLASSPDAAHGWGSFPETILQFRSTPAITIDLRTAVDRRVRAALREIGFEQPFGIITAQDPMGVPQLPAVNDARAASLLKVTAGLSVTQVRVDACSPDESHCERSIAIALDQRSAIDIARRYEQLAIFWFDGDAFWIVPVCSRNERLRLPVIM